MVRNYLELKLYSPNLYSVCTVGVSVARYYYGGEVFLAVFELEVVAFEFLCEGEAEVFRIGADEGGVGVT